MGRADAHAGSPPPLPMAAVVSLRASAPWARSATGCSRPRPGSPARIVGVHFEGAPDDNGLYGAGPGEPVELVMLGDSSAAGMGADNRYQTVGAIIATGVSALTGRPSA